MRRLEWTMLLALAVGAPPLAGQATVTRDSLPAERVTGTIWTRLPSGEALRGANATVYLWPDTPQLHAALTAACASARANPLAWIAARTELESPSGMSLDSAAAADLAMLRDIGSIPHAIATADPRGDFAFGDVPLGEYWLEAEMPHGSEMVQWWHHLSLRPVNVALARLAGRGGKAGVVEMGTPDFTRDEFCTASTPDDGIAALASDMQRNLSSRSSGPAYERVDRPVKVAVAGPPPVYPEILRLTATEGQVDYEFVVDTLGNAEPLTFRVLRSTNLDFATAVRESIMQTLFEPARLHGHKVRQLVRQSFIFRVSTTQLH